MVLRTPSASCGELSSLLCDCPHLKRAMADWLWPVEGYCRARADGRFMIPPVPYYLNLCTTPEHRLCEAFRARRRSERNPVV
jgi:hypothetical protein